MGLKSQKHADVILDWSLIIHISNLTYVGQVVGSSTYLHDEILTLSLYSQIHPPQQ